MNNNLKIFIGFILGMIISYSTVAIADTYINSNEVYYDNETSGGTYTNVKESIDELYNLASHNGSTFGDAIASDILSGKTALSGGEEITGSMVNNGGVTKSIGVGETYTIPQGYHNGLGVVTGPTLSGTAGVGDVRGGKTFYNTSGSIQTGTWSPSVTITKLASVANGKRSATVTGTTTANGYAFVVVALSNGVGSSGYTRTCTYDGAAKSSSLNLDADDMHASFFYFPVEAGKNIVGTSSTPNGNQYAHAIAIYQIVNN